MSRKFRSIALGAALIAATALGACRDTGKEQLFAISGKLFEFNYRLGIATYVVTLRPLRPMAEGQVAVVNFQNPAGGDPRFILSMAIVNVVLAVRSRAPRWIRARTLTRSPGRNGCAGRKLSPVPVE